MAIFAFAALGIWQVCKHVDHSSLPLSRHRGSRARCWPVEHVRRPLWIAADLERSTFRACLLALAFRSPAAGLDALAEAAGNRAIPRTLLWISVLCGIGLLIFAMTAGDDLDRLTPLALTGIGALLTWALFEARRRTAISARAAAVCGILLAMWEFGHVTGMDWRNIEFGWPSLDRLSGSSGVAELVRNQGLRFVSLTRTIPPNSISATGSAWSSLMA